MSDLLLVLWVIAGAFVCIYFGWFLNSSWTILKWMRRLDQRGTLHDGNSDDIPNNMPKFIWDVLCLAFSLASWRKEKGGK